MKILIESTPQTILMNRVLVRVWHGKTEHGVGCVVFVHRIAVHLDEDRTEFERELAEQLAPGLVPFDDVLNEHIKTFALEKCGLQDTKADAMPTGDVLAPYNVIPR